MSTYKINAEMIGTDATYDDAAVVAQYLTERGYNVEATNDSGNLGNEGDAIPDGVWFAALATLSA